VRVLITGGTGQLGRVGVPQVAAAGHFVRVMSRRPLAPFGDSRITSIVGDLATGVGLSEAVANIDAIIHAASDPLNARAVDVDGTRRLTEAARASGVGHLVYVSIVGVDRIPYAYYQRKRDTERVVAESSVPYSILRATQFHAFIAFLLNLASRAPLILPIPSGFHVQSVATEEVATRLCGALVDGPRGLLRDFGGPEIMPLENATLLWTQHRPGGFAKWILPIYLPGRTPAAFRAGYNTAPDGDRGTITWRDWLARVLPSRFGTTASR